MSRSGALKALLWGVAAGVLTQAVLAGLFLSGVGGARLAHTIVGWLLPYYALVVAVVTAVTASRAGIAKPRRVAVYVLPFVLWLQEVLGHLPFGWATAVHVPSGVLLFAGAVLLALPAHGDSVSPREPEKLRRGG